MGHALVVNVLGHALRFWTGVISKKDQLDGRKFGRMLVRFEDWHDALACGEICEQRFKVPRG
jgi:hypothetical protein